MAPQEEPRPSIASSSARLVPVPASHLDRVWPYLVGFIDDAARAVATVQSVERIREKIAAREMQLWAIRVADRTAGAVVTEIYDTAAGKTCGVPYLGGTGMDDWMHLLSVIEAWAKANGCVRTESVCRVGWERALKRFGWEKITITVAKTL